MREIKVRFWDDLHNKFWYGGQEGESIGNKTFQTYFKNGVLIGILSEAVSYGINQTGVDDYQEHLLTSNVYTGLKDQCGKGKEIYKGDIIEFNNCDYMRTAGHLADEIERGIIVFEDGAFWVNDRLLIDVLTNDEEAKVIGNIYEHKHLLEEKKHV